MNNSLTPDIPNFDDPIGLLRACHDRMLANCDTLEKLVTHLQEKGLDEEAKSAITGIVRYFSTSAVHHHQDEEQDLFPLLNGQSLKLADIIYRLKQDHQQLDRLWKQLAADLQQPSKLTDNPDFAEHVAQFCNAYREHIDIENRELLFLAQHSLSTLQLEDIGHAMAKRRGVKR
jgi:hemerythrin-like domain-containing protein